MFDIFGYKEYSKISKLIENKKREIDEETKSKVLTSFFYKNREKRIFQNFEIFFLNFFVQSKLSFLLFRELNSILHLLDI